MFIKYQDLHQKHPGLPYLVFPDERCARKVHGKILKKRGGQLFVDEAEYLLAAAEYGADKFPRRTREALRALRPYRSLISREDMSDILIGLNPQTHGLSDDVFQQIAADILQ